MQPLVRAQKQHAQSHNVTVGAADQSACGWLPIGRHGRGNEVCLPCRSIPHSLLVGGRVIQLLVHVL